MQRSPPFGSHADVRTLTHELTIQVKGLDEVTTKEEVHGALVDQFPDAKDLPASVVTFLTPAYGEHRFLEFTGE
ncbi:Protein of unknown function [Gryllus bimaculatus]|nr:Protein of unknown function [Gryllus bimaculatus]